MRYVGAAAVISASDIIELTDAPDGGWVPLTWPKAFYAGGNTFFGYTRGNGVDAGDVVVQKYTNATDTVSSPVVLHPNLAGLFGPPDDHAAPAILVRSEDNRINVFYCTQGDTRMRMVLSTNPLDITDFSSEALLNLGGSNFLYPVVAQLAGEASGRKYLFWKDFPGTTRIRQSTCEAGSNSWSASVQLWSSTNAFYAIGSDYDTRIDYVTTDIAPGSGGVGLYHFYQVAGQLYESDGTPIVAAIPIGPSDATQCYSDAGDAFPYSITYTSDGRPVVACAEFGATVQYFELRWDGSAWVRNDITTSDAVFFGSQPPGICHDSGDANRVMLGKDVGSEFEMFLYTTDDDGDTWSGEQITSGSGTDVPQTPIQVFRHASDLGFLWTTGDFTDDTDYSVGINGAA